MKSPSSLFGVSSFLAIKRASEGEIGGLRLRQALAGATRKEHADGEECERSDPELRRDPPGLTEKIRARVGENAELDVELIGRGAEDSTEEEYRQQFPQF